MERRRRGDSVEERRRKRGKEGETERGRRYSREEGKSREGGGEKLKRKRGCRREG